MASEAVAVAGDSKGMELRTQLRLALIEADSPYGASQNEVCELVIAAAMGGECLRGCVQRLRGIEVALPFPTGYIFYIGGEEDTILTSCDLHFWRMHPLMCGELTVIGTLGHRRTFAWDRRVVGVNAVGQVFTYEINDACFIMYVSDNLTQLISDGVSRRYIQVQRDLREGVLPQIVEICQCNEPRSPWLPPSFSQWLPVELGGVLCARVPAERIRRPIRLRPADFPDGVFKAALALSHM
ncbi:M26 [Muromegalovirus WP15B]|uniref:M26 n=1 Tax=Muromegalovirus WP15B TaxID=524651 RepID=B3UXF5_MUHV1|nr:M26 [Muromegalovirus WP15B]